MQKHVFPVKEKKRYGALVYLAILCHSARNSLLEDETHSYRYVMALGLYWGPE